MAKPKKPQRGAAAGPESGGAPASPSAGAATGSAAAEAQVREDAAGSGAGTTGAAGAGGTVAFDPPLAPPPARFGIGSYLLLNVIFDAFCLLQLLLVRVKLGEQRGLYFFFGLLMVAFFIVSVYDYLYDRYVDPVPEGAE